MQAGRAVIVCSIRNSRYGEEMQFLSTVCRACHTVRRFARRSFTIAGAEFSHSYTACCRAFRSAGAATDSRGRVGWVVCACVRVCVPKWWMVVWVLL